MEMSLEAPERASEVTYQQLVEVKNEKTENYKVTVDTNQDQVYELDDEAGFKDRCQAGPFGWPSRRS